MEDINVIIGPDLLLHSGIHNSLIEQPPSGIQYFTAEHTYLFCANSRDKKDFNPYYNYSVNDGLYFHLNQREEGKYILHTSYLPVSNSSYWVADCDCLIATLKFGRFYGIGMRESLHEIPAHQLRLRQKNMLMNYLSKYCLGICFHTQHYLDYFFQYCLGNDIVESKHLDLLAKKSFVVYPTISAPKGNIQIQEKITILYMGRSNAKGGMIALQVFDLLHKNYGEFFEFVFVGQVDNESKSKFSFVNFHRNLPRNEYLNLIPKAHIFLSPTTGESYGMGLVEAACYGLSIITSYGNNMSHIDELFKESENAYYVDNRLPAEIQVKNYYEIISSLAKNRDKLAEMMNNNLFLTNNGKLSLRRRDESLTTIYSRVNHNLESIDDTFLEEDQDMENGKYEVIALHKDIVASQREKVVNTDMNVNV